MVDYAAVTVRQQEMWATGDFHRIGVAQVIVGERLVRAVQVRAGQQVLDVAAGAGNAALAAARRFGEVIASDYVPDLLGTAARRAEAEGLPLRTEVADAQDLPYPDASFDVVLSTFGAMFAPDQEKTASEMLRVLKPGGKLGMANWTPTGFIGQLFAVAARHAPPAPGLNPPSRWGTGQGLQELVGSRGASLEMKERETDFVYPSPSYMLELYRTWFGPTATQFASLDAAGQEAFSADLLALYADWNRAPDDTVLIPSAYLEVVATKS
ncbi:MAG TPA: class I SAM-dependent methyltransferase [Mycobacteriales bacterium]|jgi:SAM-dependent methyltransferase|nr:class I SAM-dependent methyltransferase [Mycobacteriales bacterium]